MKIKNTLLLIVAILFTLGSVNAQYIENDTRFDNGPVKATRAMPTITSIENETMSITTTSAEPQLLDSVITTTNSDLDETEINDEVEAVLYNEKAVLYNEEGNTYNLMYCVAGIFTVLVIILLMNKNTKSKRND